VAKSKPQASIDVLVLLGSLSDKALAAEIKTVLDEFGVRARYEVCSAHRDHGRLAKLVPEAEVAGAQVFIAAAGMAAHLPGVVAALTTRPVIGIPASASLKGVDALLSIAQMPPGIPVACVGIDGARNAALLAVQILATSRPTLAAKLQEHRASMAARNQGDSAKLNEQLE
jgi:5-(carboxyamino)imidazole ribonucleotide mutase